MKKIKFILNFILTCILLVSCTKDNDINNSENSNPLHKGALKDTTLEEIHGRWAIYEIQSEDNTADVPILIKECGRDFFNFLPNKKYIEYIFNDSNCLPIINTLDWALSDGIITITNQLEKDEWIITKLNSDQMTIQFQADINDDGIAETLKAICKRYTPPIEMDIYTQSFRWEDFVETDDKILFSWDKYEGYNDFDKYEIYRLGDNCNDSKEELVATITDVTKNYFIDLTPPKSEELCYKLKIYTNQGLLGESSIVRVITSRIKAPITILQSPSLNGTTVNLNWNKFEGYYFSHYIIEVRNYSSGSGGGYRKEVIATINEINTTNLTVELPYFNNPVFVIYAFNIFGSRDGHTIESKNQRSTNFTRNEILPIDRIKFSEISDEETIIYYSDYSNLYKYNYSNNTIENQIKLNSSSITFIKKFKSIYGTEIIINNGGTLKVYDINLNLKYELNIDQPNFTFRAGHLIVNDNGYWLITDREKIYSFNRNDNKLNFINSVTPYNEKFSSSLINIINLKQNKILAGNYLKENGVILNINSSGILNISKASVNIKTTSPWKNNGLFSSENNYFLNIDDNSLYSTESYNLITKLNDKFFTSNVANNGSLIIGTYNTPETTQNSFHERKITTISYPSFKETKYNTKGYPGIIYQNHLGQLISVSKGLIGSVSNGIPNGGIFIEVIDLNN